VFLQVPFKIFTLIQTAPIILSSFFSESNFTEVPFSTKHNFFFVLFMSKDGFKNNKVFSRA